MDVNHKFEKIMENIEEEQERWKRENLGDTSALVGLGKLGWNSTTPVEKVVEYFHLDFEHSTEPELVSFLQMFARGKDFFVTDQRGLISLYKDMYKPFEDRIYLEKVVKKISYSDEGVDVVTSDGETFHADYALGTFSNGVLQSDMVEFSPVLPDWKKDSISKSPMSVYSKIFLKFPRKFWDDREYILFASKQRGYYPVFQDLERYGLAGSGILLVTTTGKEAKRVEKQTENQTKAEIMDVLRGIYGQDIPEPIGEGSRDVLEPGGWGWGWGETWEPPTPHTHIGTPGF